MNYWRTNFVIYQRRTIINFLQSLGYQRPKRQIPNILEDLMHRINNWHNNGHEEEEEEVDDQAINHVFHHNQAETQSFIDKHRKLFAKRHLDDVAVIDVDLVNNQENLRHIPLYFHLLHLQENR